MWESVSDFVGECVRLCGCVSVICVCLCTLVCSVAPAKRVAGLFASFGISACQ